MTIEWITHKEKQILYSDYRGKSEEQRIAQLREEADIILAQDAGVLLLHNIDGILASKPIMSALKEQQATVQPHLARSAVTGVRGLTLVFLAAVNRFSKSGMRAFGSIDDAKDWLVS